MHEAHYESRLESVPDVYDISERLTIVTASAPPDIVVGCFNGLNYRKTLCRVRYISAMSDHSPRYYCTGWRKSVPEIRKL